MAYAADVVKRNLIGDFLGGFSATPTYAPIVKGLVQLDENPNPKVDKTPFTNNTGSPSSDITWYEPVFPFDIQMRTSETVTMALVSVFRDRKTGDDAKFYLVRVDFYDAATEGAYPARRMKVSAEISSVEAAGNEIVRIKGNFHQDGDHTDGTLNPTAPVTFSAA